MSDDNRDVTSQTDLDAALKAAKPTPKVSHREVAEDVERADAYNADAGVLDYNGPAADQNLNPGHLYERDPKPGNLTGTRGIESTPEDIPESSRGIAGAYSGDPEKLRDEDRNNNQSKA